MIGGPENIAYSLTDLSLSPNAQVYFLEHRYYGQSKPNLTDNQVDNLQWLTVEQALADVNRFVLFLRRNVVGTIHLVGSRYGGSLAVWYRQRYPDTNIVHTAVALSAPLEARIDESHYLELVGDQIRRIGGDGCYERIEYGIHRAEELFNNRSFDGIVREFRACRMDCDGCHIRFLNIFMAANFGRYAQEEP